ncbi:MAG: AlkA N-terminal domain-containing protein, partial [Stutzerimonas sp.]
MSQTLYLPYLEPWNWSQFYQHFAMRLLPGVEALSANSYSRSVHVGQLRGWLSVAPLADRPALALTLSDALQPVQSAIAARVRRMFDLDADPVAIAAHLCQDAKLAPGVLANPGLRVPAAYDPFEQ